MVTFLFIIGICFAVLAAILFFASFMEGSFGVFILSIFFGAACAACFIGSSNSDSNSDTSNQVSAAQNVENSTDAAGTESTGDDSSASNNTSSSDDNSSTTNQSSSDDSKWPRNYPGDDASREVRMKWWQDWTDDVLKEETTIGCKDGVQIVVFGDAQTSGDYQGSTKWAGGYVRVHQDGKPYSCDESKDPAKEVSL
jgi:hypothetical protein